MQIFSVYRSSLIRRPEGLLRDSLIKLSGASMCSFGGPCIPYPQGRTRDQDSNLGAPESSFANFSVSDTVTSASLLVVGFSKRQRTSTRFQAIVSLLKLDSKQSCISLARRAAELPHNAQRAGLRARRAMPLKKQRYRGSSSEYPATSAAPEASAAQPWFKQAMVKVSLVVSTSGRIAPLL